MQKSNQNLGEFWKKIISRSWADPDFKKQLLANPKDVLKKEYGLDVPANIKFTEAPANTILVVIPNKPVSKDLEESELRNIAGGGNDSSGEINC